MNAQQAMTAIGVVLVLAGFITSGVAVWRGRKRKMNYGSVSLAILDAEIERVDRAIRLARVGQGLCAAGTIVSFIAMGMAL